MSKFLSYEDRLIIAQRVQENASFGAIGKELGKDRTTIAKEIKNIPTTRKVVVPDTLITLVNFGLPVKQKNCAKPDVPTSQHINVAYVLNVPCTVLILQKKSALLKQSRHMSAMAAENFRNAHCSNESMIRQMHMKKHISLFRKLEQVSYLTKMI